jgi:hypothetical protein
VLAAIPALHILLVWCLPARRLSAWDYAALAAQAALITFAIHVRWPTLWIVAGLVFCSVVASIARRSARELAPGGIVLGIAVIGIAVARLVAHPIYNIEGDLLHHPAWHNMMTSLQNHPTWRERYLPTVGGAWGDPMPGVIAAQEIAKLPADQRAPYFYSWIEMPNPHAVDTFARKRFFEILHEDPRMVLETFLFIAPQQLWSGITSYHASHAAAASPAAIMTIIVALCCALWIAATDAGSAPVLLRLTMCAALLSVLAAVPNFIGGPHPLYMIDHFLWSFFCVGLALCLAPLAVLLWLQERLGISEPAR